MIEQHFPTPRPVRLEVTVPAGEIDVTTVDGAESTVTVEGAQKLLDVMTIELIGDRLVVAPRRKTFSRFLTRFDGPLHVRAQVPHQTTVELMTASGAARLDGAFGGLETTSASGDVRVSGELDGNVTAQTVSGDVHMPHVTGEVKVNTVSGDVRIDSLHGGQVRVRSVSGDIDLGIAPGTGIDVDAASVSGELGSELPLSASPSDEGGPTVVVRGQTVSGDVRVFRAR
jgi:hypothetical protein